MNVSLSTELEVFVNEQLKSGRYASVTEIIADALYLLKQEEQQHEENGVTDTRPIWEVFADIMSDVSEEEMNNLPTDAAAQHDHYIYGLPKKPV